ncbi:MAG: hypothetical protein DI606_04445 [Sphingobium sp.]|uniref:hypothetical protein n=1 Tax=Sphingobium sp. TaxID=1912891 RepID=UPI000DB57BF5|nr:hypothetical protein [Sphingobium sp.]PZU13821.1 MAG: hypothetical protein DI606_04445 [Sphingobium sp.]
MSSIMLPNTPGVRNVRMMVLSFGSVLTPFLGGPSQRINRLGTRWAMRVSMPPMRAEAARPWIDALARGCEDGVIMRIPQDIDIGVPGAPLVSAAVTAGMILPIKGLAPGYAVKRSQRLSVIHNGRRYNHVFSADAVANGSGVLNAAIWPMIRTGLSVNDTIEIAAPMIEGWLDGNFEWDVLTMPWVQLPDFTISEAA